MKNKKLPVIISIVSGAVTLIICGVMNLIFIPQIESETQGIKCFDMNFCYSPDTAREFLKLIGDKGRYVYLHYQPPLDFIYPVFYTAFFVSLILLVIKNRKKLKIFTALPLFLALFDYSENIMSIIMLNNGVPSNAFAVTASSVTAFKTLLMYFIIISIVIYSVQLIIKKRKVKNNNADI